MGIAKLRRLTEAARRTYGEQVGHGVLLDLQARAELSPVAIDLLLPAMEALEGLLLAHRLACGESLTAARKRDEGRAVLRRLEEALG